VWAVSQKRECVSKVRKVTRQRGVSLSYFGEAAFALTAGLRWMTQGRLPWSWSREMLCVQLFSALPCKQEPSRPGSKMWAPCPEEGMLVRVLEFEIGWESRSSHQWWRSKLNSHLNCNNNNDGDDGEQLHECTHADGESGGGLLEAPCDAREALHALMQWGCTRRVIGPRRQGCFSVALIRALAGAALARQLRLRACREPKKRVRTDLHLPHGPVWWQERQRGEEGTAQRAHLWQARLDWPALTARRGETGPIFEQPRRAPISPPPISRPLPMPISLHLGRLREPSTAHQQRRCNARQPPVCLCLRPRPRLPVPQTVVARRPSPLTLTLTLARRPSAAVSILGMGPFRPFAQQGPALLALRSVWGRAGLPSSNCAQCSSVLSAQCSVLSAQCSVLSAQCSVLSAQCSVLSAQCSVLPRRLRANPNHSKCYRVPPPLLPQQQPKQVARQPRSIITPPPGPSLPRLVVAPVPCVSRLPRGADLPMSISSTGCLVSVWTPACHSAPMGALSTESVSRPLCARRRLAGTSPAIFLAHGAKYPHHLSSLCISSFHFQWTLSSNPSARISSNNLRRKAIGNVPLPRSRALAASKSPYLSWHVKIKDYTASRTHRDGRAFASSKRKPVASVEPSRQLLETRICFTSAFHHHQLCLVQPARFRPGKHRQWVNCATPPRTVGCQMQLCEQSSIALVKGEQTKVRGALQDRACLRSA
ncbi:hypothetical protein PMIN01_04087, partial [Paraphaeosphaeria minitans]